MGTTLWEKTRTTLLQKNLESASNFFVKIQVSVIICYWLHCEKKNLCQQMGIVLLRWQVGLIANVKLHFFYFLIM